VIARTHNGEIISDYPAPSPEGDNKLATFQIGSGGTKITLSAENGDVRIKKGSTSFPTAPPAPNAVAVPKAPAAPGTPHLSSRKALPPHPGTN
jgi:hypothetical protein